MANQGFTISMIIAIAILAMLPCSSAQAISAGNTDQMTTNHGVDQPYDMTLNAHRMTSIELQQLKATTGVRDPSRNYNQIINGHGTGLAPPTDEEWDWMAKNVIVIDAFLKPQSKDLATYDISSSPYFPAIGDQGLQGSCAAWASTYYTYGYLEALDNGWSNASSGYAGHLMSPAWTYDMVNGGSDAGSSRYYNMEIISEWGVPSLATMPYDQYDYLSWGTPQAFREAALHRAENIYYLSYTGQPTVDSVKTLVQNHVPITFSIDAYELDPAFSDGNYVVSSTEYDSTTTNHAQTVVGFDDAIGDDGDFGAFKIANSWGSSWGNNGYYWLTYSAFKEIGSRLNIYYLSDRLDYQPDTLATWHFDTCPTRDVYLEIGLKDGGTTVAYRAPFFYPDSSHNLPPYLSLDVTDISSYYSSEANDFYLYVGSGTSSGTISSFKIELYELGYVPGVPSHVSGQATGLKASTPATVINSFPHYGYCTAAEALDSFYISSHTLSDTSTYATWVPVRHHYSYDGDAMQSGDISHLSHSSFKLQMPGPSTIEFDWMVSSEPTYDALSFYVDDVQMDSISGITGWSTENYSLVNGSHIIEWRYDKDISISSNDDCGWIDHIAISGIDVEPPVLNITSPPEGSIFASSSVTINWTAIDSGSGLGYFESSLDGGIWTNESLTTSRSYSSLADGLHSAAIRAWDNASNNAVSQVHFRVDTVSPLMVITNPTDGGYCSSSTIQLSWSGVDPSPGSGITSYQVRIDGGSWLSMDLNTSYSIILSEGVHSAYAKAFDAAGNSGSTAIGFVVDLTDPIVSITFPVIDASLINSKSLDMTWTGNDALSGIDHYRIGLDGTLTDLDNINHHELQNLAEGGHTATVIAVDKAGNTNSDSVTFSVDTVAPIIVILSPISDGCYSTSTISASWLGSDPGPASGIWFYWTKLDGGGWINQSAATSQSLTLSEGAHTIQVRVFDMAMNTASASRSFTIDTISPTVVISQPLVDAYINTTSVMVEWITSDTGSGINFTEVRIDGSSTWTNVGTVSAHTFTGLSGGAHTVDVRTFDMAMNTAGASRSFIVDTIAPTVVISQPLVNAYINVTSVMVVWTASDAGGSGINYTEVRIDGNATWINVGTDSAYTFTGLSDGAHVADVRTFDMAMNTASASRSFTIDTVAPVVTISFPAEGQLFDVDTVTVYWNATDLNGIDHCEVSIDGGAFVSVGSDISKVFDMLNDGMHNVVVKAFDLAMNTNTSYVNFVTDSTDPEITISFPGLGYMTKLDNVTVYWNATDATSGVNHTTYAIDGGAAVKIEGVGPYSMWFAALSEGSHTVEVIAYDVAGHHKGASIAFLVDLTAPTIAITAPVDGHYYNVALIHGAWTVVDPTSGVAEILVKLDGAVNWTSIGWNATHDFAGLTHGDHTIYVKAIDNVTNERIVSVTFCVDLIAPDVKILLPGSSTGPQPLGVGTTNVTFTFEVEEEGCGIAYYDVSIDNGTVVYYDHVTVFSIGALVAYDVTGLPDGSYNITIYAIDNATNVGSDTLWIFVDTEAPLLEITYPADGGFFSRTWMNVTWVTSDPDGMMENTTVFLDTVLVSDQSWTQMWYNFTGLGQGFHNVTMKAHDIAWNEAVKSVVFTIDTIAPTVVISQPLVNAYINATSVMVVWTASDSGSGINYTEVRIDGATWTNVGTDSAYTFTGLSDGAHTVDVRTFDMAMNTYIASRSFTIDTVAPTITAKSPTGVAVAIGTTVSVTFSEAMLTSSVSIVGVPTVTMGTPVWSNSDKTVTWTPSSALTYATGYTLTVSGTDLAGNAISGDRTIVFSTITQVTGTVKDANGNPIQGANVTLSMPGMTTVYALTDANGHFAIVIAGGTYSLTVTKSGFDDLSKQITVGPGLVNNLGNLSMNPTADYTLPIVIVVIVLGAALVFLFLRRRKA